MLSGWAKAFFREALTIEPDFLPAQARLLLLERREASGSEARQLIAAIHRGRAAGDEWPDSAIDEALLEAGFGHPDAALRALDTAIDLGYRDAGWLLLDPMLAELRREPSFLHRIETIRRRVDAERQRVVGAAWLPPALLDGNAARM